MKLPLYNSAKYIVAIIITLILGACGTSNKMKSDVFHFDKQAHRGGRGLMPENTIAAHKNAIDLNTTLEMDLQMSRDRKIVVSHDPFFNSDFVLTPEGKTMTKKDGRSRLLFEMNYDSISKYDVGMKPHPGFPNQKKMHAIKPLLSVLIDSVERYANEKKHINHYNIEIKSSPNGDGRFYPSLESYVDSALRIIIDKGIASRTMVQSFDVRALQLVHNKYPEIAISFLVSKVNKKDAAAYIQELGFKPEIFSPDYSLVTKDLVKTFHELNVRVIPWTPNTVEEIQQLKEMGVDGIITDYPNLFSEVK